MMTRNKKKIFNIFLVLSLSIGIFFIVPTAHATVGDWAGEVLGGIIGWIIGALGIILSLLMSALVLVAQYSNFIGSPAVENGWVIVRDICNMFFVLILLIIAFVTILKLEEYSYKKWLPKLILMAILINFSKTICGLLIDIAQVVMLTFVNAFKDIAAGNLVTNLGLKEVITLANNNKDIGFWAIVGAYVLGLIYVLISLVVITAMLAMLVMRIVMIWIYVVLSPMAYLMSAFPGGQKYASQWWSEFTKNLIVGPVLAFFIWLSFASLSVQDFKGDFKINDTNTEQIAGEVGVVNPGDSDDSMGATQASTPDVFIRFIIAIGMLIGGLKISQEIGGAAGSIAGKGMNQISSGAAFVGKKAGSMGKGLLTGDNYFARKFAKSTGWDFRPVTLQKNFKSAMESSRKKDENYIRDKSRQRFESGGVKSAVLGIGAGEDYFNRYIDGFLGWKGIARAGKDIFYSPFKRGALGGKIDKNGAEADNLKTEREDLLASKKPEMDNYVNDFVNNNTDLADLKRSQRDNESRINQLKNKVSLSGVEKDRLKDLEKNGPSINDEIAKKEAALKAEATSKFLRDDQDISDIDLKIKINQESLRDLKNDIMKVQKPVGLESRSIYRKSIEEAKSKYSTLTNSDELQKALADAIKRKDKFDQIAILEKLSSDGNLNDELAAKGYASSAVGLYKYVNNQKNDYGENKGLVGFSGSGKLQVLSDLAESEERVNHWDMAKMVAMDSKGQMESLVKEIKKPDGTVEYDDIDHATAAYAEVMKMDPQQAVIKLNRLAYGGEDGRGDFQIASLGKMLYKALAEGDAYTNNKGRIQSNAAANLSSENIIPILRKILANDQAKSNEVISLLKLRGSGKGEVSFKAGDMAAWLRNSDVK
jgi:hypothetical protein